MKYAYFAISLTILSFQSFAQNTVPKIPVYEVFSSSTCGPCRPSNEHLSPLFADYRDQLAIVKYQMNWPGNGDPYFSTEANGRRNLYGINSIPYFVRNAATQAYSSFDEEEIDADLAQEASMILRLKYKINADSQTIAIRAQVQALGDYSGGAHRLLIPIVERETKLNKESNGETVFHNVFKKMLPSASGQIIIGQLDSGYIFDYDSIYTFQGDYRLPNDANDPIDNASEHSVEDFDSLHVIMFMQSMEASKEIYQGVVGEQCFTWANFNRPWDSPLVAPVGTQDVNGISELQVHPNPASETLSVRFGQNRTKLSVTLYNLQGQILIAVEFQATDDLIELDIRSLPAGIYYLKVSNEFDHFLEKLVISE